MTVTFSVDLGIIAAGTMVL